MSNVYDMNGKKKVVMEEKEDEDITYKEIMKIIIENATEEGCHQIFSYGGIDMCPSDIFKSEIIDKKKEEDICNYESIGCTKCLNNQSCISAADYGSIYCMSHRKFKMPNNEIDSIVEDLNENKITPNQAREKLCLPKIKSAIEKENDRLLELCMFALLPKRIYNHELADKTKEAFKNIIKKNINEDTYTIRNEIVRYWDGKTKK